MTTQQCTCKIIPKCGFRPLHPGRMDLAKLCFGLCSVKMRLKKEVRTTYPKAKANDFVELGSKNSLLTLTKIWNSKEIKDNKMTF